jgi:phosphate starvation-inducible PhoH-like protein
MMQLEKILAGEKEIQPEPGQENVLVFGPGGTRVTAKTPNQTRIVQACEQNDMIFAIGPAGTGKTYTAVALAVRALKEKHIKRIILTRPAVEAGENLGFLPGDLKEKLDPYLQPLYDALMDMIPYEKLAEYIEKNIIEIAPLAFMRGRTLDKAFVILDEAQNATVGQMKMFLTRMGQNAKFIITGDASQIDLPRSQKSGLMHAVNILRNTPDIAIIELDDKDVIRHKLVRKIIQAYEKSENES